MIRHEMGGIHCNNEKTVCFFKVAQDVTSRYSLFLRRTMMYSDNLAHQGHRSGDSEDTVNRENEETREHESRWIEEEVSRLTNSEASVVGRKRVNAFSLIPAGYAWSDKRRPLPMQIARPDGRTGGG